MRRVERGAENGEPGAELERSDYYMLGVQRGNCCCSHTLLHNEFKQLHFAVIMRGFASVQNSVNLRTQACVVRILSGF